MRVAAFTKYGRAAASTRQRVLQYLPALEAAGIHVEYYPLLGSDYVHSLATGIRSSRARIAASYVGRIRQLAFGTKADALWVYAELFPYLPAAFERLAFRSGKPVVYDFDDAFFHQYDDSPRRAVRAALTGKLEPLLRGAAACACGNAYLQSYASRFCANSIVLPTVVDTDIYRPLARNPGEAPVIGWIGSPSTWQYVRPLLPLLRELTIELGVRVRVVGAGAKAVGDGFPGLDFVEWREDAEVDEVRAMDIGIMPLPDEPWTRGKSGYKLVQYMACGLPVVASPVGVNGDMVRDGENGFLARDPGEWRAALARLIADPSLRAQMGSAGRQRAEAEYSLRSQAPRLVSLFNAIKAS